MRDQIPSMSTSISVLETSMSGCWTEATWTLPRHGRKFHSRTATSINSIGEKARGRSSEVLYHVILCIRTVRRAYLGINDGMKRYPLSEVEAGLR